MNRKNKVMIIPLIFALLVTILLGGYGILNGKHVSIKSHILFFGSVAILSFVLTFAVQAMKDIIVEFFDSNTKGKIIIALIVLTYVLRALYQMKLAN